MKTFLKTSIALAAGLALVALVLATAGCGGGGASANYTRVDQAFSGANITYEYPNGFQAPPGGPGDTSLTYMHFLGQVEEYNADTMLFIETANLTPGQAAADVLQTDMNTIMKQVSAFHLIRWTTTRVAGYAGSEVAFTATYSDTPLSSLTTTTWVSYFSRGDKVWEIGVMADPQVEAAAEAEYQHLVDSFAFK